MTSEGASIYGDIDLALRQLARATANAANLQRAVAGRLIISAPAAYAQAVIATLLPRFTSENPVVSVDVQADNRLANLLDESVDLAVRVILELSDSRLRATRLGAHRLWTVAAPAWLSQLGPTFDWPRLARVPGACFRKAETRQVETWRFKLSRGFEERLPPLLTVMNDNATMQSWSVSGGGVAQLPDYAVRSAVARGELVRVWPITEVGAAGIHGVFAEHARRNLALRAFITHLRSAHAEIELAIS